MLIGPESSRLPRSAQRAPTAPAAVMVAAAAMLAAAALRGQASCSLEWAAGFEPDGADNRILAMAMHDDGSGPALYVGGHFVAAGAEAAFGPYLAPTGLVVDALCSDVTGGQVQCWSSVARFTVP